MGRFSLFSSSRSTTLSGTNPGSALENSASAALESGLGSALQFDELFQGLPIACLSYDEQGRILNWNAAAQTLFGWPASEIRGKTLWQSIARPEDHAALRQQLSRVFSGESFNTQEHQYLCADGATRSVSSNSFPLHDEKGKVVAGLSACVDLSGRIKAEERLDRHAFHDRLTGLPDRTRFLEGVEVALRRSRQKDDYEFAVLLLNLDRFKVANESLGHGAGDQLLVSIARKLEACVAPGDTVARLGGDEFALLLDNIKGEEEAVQTAERIQKRLSIPITANRQEIFISVSIGIVTGASAIHAPKKSCATRIRRWIAPKAAAKRATRFSIKV